MSPQQHHLTKIPLISIILSYASKSPRSPLVYAQVTSSWAESVREYSVVPRVWQGLLDPASINHALHNPDEQCAIIKSMSKATVKCAVTPELLWYLKKLFEADIDEHLLLDPVPNFGTVLHVSAASGNLEALEFICEKAVLLKDPGSAVPNLGPVQQQEEDKDAKSQNKISPPPHPVVSAVAKKAFNLELSHVTRSPLLKAIAKKQAKSIEILLRYCPQYVDINQSFQNVFPVWNACEVNDLECLKVLCEKGDEYGLDINQKKQGVNCLFIACQLGFDDTVDYLLNGLPENSKMKQELDVNLRDSNLGMTNMYIASGKLRAKVLKLLLEDPRTDKSLLTNLSASPLHICAQETTDDNPKVEDGLECLRLLLKHGFDVNALHHNTYSPLAAAFAKGNIRAARLLIEEGNADTTWKSNNFKSLADLAKAKGHKKIVRELIPEQGNLFDKMKKIFD